MEVTPAWVHHDTLGRQDEVDLNDAAEIGRAKAVTLTAAALCRAATRKREVNEQVQGRASHAFAHGIWMAMAPPLQRQQMGTLDSTLSGSAEATRLSSEQREAHAKRLPYPEGAGTSTKAPVAFLMPAPLVSGSLSQSGKRQECQAPREECQAPTNVHDHRRWIDPKTGLPYVRVNYHPRWLDKNGARLVEAEYVSWLDPNGVKRSGHKEVSLQAWFS